MKRLVTLHGETLLFHQWCDRLGLNRGTTYARVRHGWSMEDALLTPVGQPNPHPDTSLRVRIRIHVGIDARQTHWSGRLTEEAFARICNVLSTEGLVENKPIGRQKLQAILESLKASSD